MKKGTAETYRVFIRTTWPNGLEPGIGRSTTIASHCTYDEARAIAKKYNTTHKPGRLSRKAEFEAESYDDPLHS